jgi:hypothetical protein
VICISIYTFWYGRIDEIRPLILLGLGGAFLEGFCHSRHLLVDVVDDAALLLERLMWRLFEGAVLLKLIAKIVVDLLEALAVACAVAEGIADEEAEGG